MFFAIEFDICIILSIFFVTFASIYNPTSFTVRHQGRQLTSLAVRRWLSRWKRKILYLWFGPVNIGIAVESLKPAIKRPGAHETHMRQSGARVTLRAIKWQIACYHVRSCSWCFPLLLNSRARTHAHILWRENPQNGHKDRTSKRVKYGNKHPRSLSALCWKMVSEKNAIDVFFISFLSTAIRAENERFY